MAKKKPAGSSSPHREQPGDQAPEPPAPEHPNREILRRFMRGEATAAEGAEIVSHLIAGCRRCREVTRSVWLRARGIPSEASAGPEIHPSSYAGVWKRTRRTRKLQEQLMEADRHEARRHGDDEGGHGAPAGRGRLGGDAVDDVVEADDRRVPDRGDDIGDSALHQRLGHGAGMLHRGPETRIPWFAHSGQRRAVRACGGGSFCRR